MRKNFDFKNDVGTLIFGMYNFSSGKFELNSTLGVEQRYLVKIEKLLPLYMEEYVPDLIKINTHPS